MRLSKYINVAAISALLMLASSPAFAQQTQFGNTRPMPIGGGNPTTGQINMFLTDSFGNICNVGPVGIGGSYLGYYPVVGGGLDLSNNVQAFSITSTGALAVQNVGGTSGGLSIGKIVSLGSTNAVSAKATPGNLYSWNFFNAAAYSVFVHFYNKASAPTVGTDVPVFTIGIAAGGSASHTAQVGYTFSTGIAYSITKGAGDTDATATLAGDLVGVVGYK